MRTYIDCLILLVICVVLFVGCATVEPRVSTVTNTVLQPVPVPCITVADIPVLPKPTPIDLDKSTHDQVVAANAADLANMDAYAALADPLLRQCATKP